MDEVRDGGGWEEGGAAGGDHDLWRRKGAWLDLGGERRKEVGGREEGWGGEGRVTGSRTHVGRLCFWRAAATASTVEAEASMPGGIGGGWSDREGKEELGPGPTDLDDVDADVIETGVNLLGDEGGGHIVDVGYAQGILSGQGRRGCHGIALMCSEHFLVCF